MIERKRIMIASAVAILFVASGGMSFSPGLSERIKSGVSPGQAQKDAGMAVDLPALLQRMAPYFEPAQGGHMIDQAWQPRLAEGMVRAYLVEDRVTGFGHQAVNALVLARDGEPTPQPGPRLYHGPDRPEFQALKQSLETQWVELLRQRVGVARERLPLLWDMDFMFGERAAGQAERYALCEINVSSVSPFPPSSIEPLVQATKARLAGI